ncbi:MAG: hypothetical protein JSS09_00305 [Verrucomicrobia bacterium]|nr:hypothetical protein [Verrucomicrobiota bacterium]
MRSSCKRKIFIEISYNFPNIEVLDIRYNDLSALNISGNNLGAAGAADLLQLTFVI